MVKEAPTVAELRRAAEASNQEKNAAVDAVLAGLAAESYPPAKGGTLERVETSRTNTRADEPSSADKVTDACTVVRTAKSRAHSVKG